MTLLDRPTTLDIADRCISEVLQVIIIFRISEINLNCGAMSADSIKATVAFVYYLAVEENVAK